MTKCARLQGTDVLLAVVMGTGVKVAVAAPVGLAPGVGLTAAVSAALTVCAAIVCAMSSPGPDVPGMVQASMAISKAGMAKVMRRFMGLSSEPKPNSPPIVTSGLQID
jgi:hypothetical protein